jgi:hypothetical protein
MKHISEYNYGKGHSFNGYRVSILRKGIQFCKYISASKIGMEAALKEAIRVEADLSEQLAECLTVDELLEFKKLW